MADHTLYQSGIYRIRNTANGKCYVGSAISLIRRFTVHKCDLKRGQHRSKPLQRAWEKYGPETFIFEVLEIVPDKAALTTREQYWLDALGSHVDKNGYNVCPVAQSRLGMKMPQSAKNAIGTAARGRKMSEETKKKIREAWKHRAPPSAETRAKIGAANLGRKRPPEFGAKMAAINRGRRLSDAQKMQISKVHKGKKITQAQKDAVRQAHLGKKRSPEAIAKMRAASKGRIRTKAHCEAISRAKRAAFAASPTTQLKLAI